MPKRKNPETSIEAYHSLQPSEIREVYKKIIKALSEIKEGHTEDIAAAAGLDHGKIWKRMHELNDMGLIERPGNKKENEERQAGLHMEVDAQWRGGFINRKSDGRRNRCRF